MEPRWPGGFSTDGGHERLSFLLDIFEELFNLTTEVLEDRAGFFHSYSHPFPLQFECVAVVGHMSKPPKAVGPLDPTSLKEHRQGAIR